MKEFKILWIAAVNDRKLTRASVIKNSLLHTCSRLASCSEAYDIRQIGLLLKGLCVLLHKRAEYILKDVDKAMKFERLQHSKPAQVKPAKVSRTRQQPTQAQAEEITLREVTQSAALVFQDDMELMDVPMPVASPIFTPERETRHLSNLTTAKKYRASDQDIELSKNQLLEWTRSTAIITRDILAVSEWIRKHPPLPLLGLDHANELWQVCPQNVPGELGLIEDDLPLEEENKTGPPLQPSSRELERGEYHFAEQAHTRQAAARLFMTGLALVSQGRASLDQRDSGLVLCVNK